MSEPTLGPFGQAVFDQLEPLAYADEENGWVLKNYIAAISEAFFEDIEALIRDSDTHDGWGTLLDVDECPAYALPWLAQLVGVRSPPKLASETDVDYATRLRQSIKDHKGFDRGTPAAITNAAKDTLTGSKAVFMYERFPTNAYNITISTRTAETPDPDATEAAIRAVKPAGLKLTYNVVAGQLWAEVEVAYATWAAVEADYTTWEDVRLDTP